MFGSSGYDDDGSGGVVGWVYDFVFGDPLSARDRSSLSSSRHTTGRTSSRSGSHSGSGSRGGVGAASAGDSVLFHDPPAFQTKESILVARDVAASKLRYASVMRSVLRRKRVVFSLWVALVSWMLLMVRFGGSAVCCAVLCCAETSCCHVVSWVVLCCAVLPRMVVARC